MQEEATREDRKMLIFLSVFAPLVRLFGNDEHFIFVGIRAVMPTLTLQNEREFIKQRQREGVAAAKARGVRFGRERIPVPDDFSEIVAAWEHGEIPVKEAARRCGMAEATFYRRLKEYREGIMG